MAFMQRTRVVPALGKVAEVEAQLADWVKSNQAGGRRIALSRRVLSSEGPMFVVVRVADDLAGIERMRQEDAGSADFRARAQQITPLMREPVKSVLLESIVTAPRRAGTTISSITSTYPTPGKEAQVVSILEELVRAGQAAGVTTALFRRVFSSDGSSISVLSRYGDLAELDRTIKERRQIIREAFTAIGEMSRAPVAMRLTESIVHLPPT